MNPLLHSHRPLLQDSPLRQSFSTLQPGRQNLSMQISPCKQFLSEWQSFRHIPSSTHCSPLAQSPRNLQLSIQYPFRHLCPGGQVWPEQVSGILTQPWMAVGTPANPGGQLQCSALFLAWHLEFGPQVLPTEQGSTHRS